MDSFESIQLISHGELNKIPFEALIDKDGNYVVQTKNVNYQPALSFITASYLKKPSYKNSWTGFGISEGSEQSLKGSINELKDLAAKTKGQLLFNNNTNASNLFQYAKDSRILHLALHSKVNLESPLYSELLLFEEQVTASEIYNQDIQSDLVVLSACDTGFGKIEKGEGIMSFSRAFTYAGAKSTVNSLWEVPDIETAKLMRMFYDNIDRGMQKHQALAMAKQTYINSSDDHLLRHPFFWAGFVVSGDISPIHKPASKKAYIWVALGLMLIILFYLYRRRLGI